MDLDLTDPIVRAFLSGYGRAAWEALTPTRQLELLPRVRRIVALAEAADDPLAYAARSGINLCIEQARIRAAAPRVEAVRRRREVMRMREAAEREADRATFTLAVEEFRALVRCRLALNPRSIACLTLVWRVYFRGLPAVGHAQKYRSRVREWVTTTALGEVLDWHHGRRPHLDDLRSALPAALPR